MNIYISIGTQCTTAKLFERLQVKAKSLPFDWMLSTPHFVYTILQFLLIDQKEIEDIVDNHFFACDKRATHSKIQQNFVIDDIGTALINSKYNVCFPHDTLNDRGTYIRRMERLKQVILNNDNFIHFIYVSVPSITRGAYAIDGVDPIEKLYEYIEKINSIIKAVRTHYKILIFDTNKPSDIVPSDISHMVYYDIEEKTEWQELLPELADKFNSYILSSNENIL